MNHAEERVLGMLQEGKITKGEADELMRSLSGERGRWRRVLLNPFSRLPTGKGLIGAGIVAALSLVLATRLGIRFDGALDVHASGGSVTLVFALLDQAVGLLLLAVALWAASRLAAREGRFIDFLVVSGIARLPLLLLGSFLAFALPNPLGILEDPLRLLLVAIVSMLFVVWFVVWLYQGYKTASGLAGARLVMSFIAALAVAEVASKVVLYVAPQPAVSVEAAAAAAYSLPGETPDARAEAFLYLLEASEFAKAHSTFTAKMAKGLPVTALGVTYQTRKWKQGKLVRIEAVEASRQGDLTVVDLDASYEKSREIVRVVFDAEQRVAGLWFPGPKPQ
jgi:hypothetical protein